MGLGSSTMRPPYKNKASIWLNIWQPLLLLRAGYTLLVNQSVKYIHNSKFIYHCHLQQSVSRTHPKIFCIYYRDNFHGTKDKRCNSCFWFIMQYIRSSQTWGQDVVNTKQIYTGLEQNTCMSSTILQHFTMTSTFLQLNFNHNQPKIFYSESILYPKIMISTFLQLNFNHNHPKIFYSESLFHPTICTTWVSPHTRTFPIHHTISTWYTAQCITIPWNYNQPCSNIKHICK